MSSHRLVWIACDGDGCDQTTAENDASTVKDAEEIAQAWGWTRRGRRWFCGRHDMDAVEVGET